MLGSPLLGPGQDNGYSLQRMRLYKRDQAKDIATPANSKSGVRRVIRTKRVKTPQPLDTDEEDDIDEKMAFKRDIERVSNDNEEIEIEEKREVEENIDSDKTEKRTTNKREADGSDEVEVDKTENEKSETVKRDVEENIDTHEIEKINTHKREAGQEEDKKENKKSETVKRDVDNIGDDNGQIKDPESLVSFVKPAEREKRSKEEENINNEYNRDEIKPKSKRETEKNEKVQKKRTALLGDSPFGVIPGSDLSGLFAGDGYILGAGGIKFHDDNNHHQSEEETQMEPAEWEVRSIMAVCTGCSEDPFRKATLISWRETPKKLFSGVLYIPAIPECQRF